MIRVPTVAQAEHVVRALDLFAETAARLTHCDWKREWIAKSRPGLANHALARVTYANLVEAGPPQWGPDAVKVAQALQKNLGHGTDGRAVPGGDLHPGGAGRGGAAAARHDPAGANPLHLRRLHRLLLADPDGAALHRPARTEAAAGPGGYPDWAMNALGGIEATIDPMITSAARTIAGTILDLLTDPAHLAAARAEFDERTGGGIGGTRGSRRCATTRRRSTTAGRST